MTTTATGTAIAPDTTATSGCTECIAEEKSWKVSRRSLLAGSVAAGAAIALNETVTIHTASAATSENRDTIVLISFRGGMDGLSAVVPVGDPAYYTARPTIAIPAAATLKLDSRFGLHPALARLMPLWDNGTMGIVHATGLPEINQSHFSAMDALDRAAPGSQTRTGWLNRAVGLNPETTVAPFRMTNLGGRKTPTDGPGGAISIDNLRDFRLNNASDPSSIARWSQAMGALHSDATAPVRDTAQVMLGALSSAKEILSAPPGSSVVYPDSNLGRALSDAARLIRSPEPIAAITIDTGAWDMHENLGTVDGGWMFGNLTGFANCISLFVKDLGALMNNVTIATISEFGRGTSENKSGGVDHGWGNCMFLFGGGVNGGGSVRGTWPGLAPTSVSGLNLRPTTDYRAVLADVLQNRCGMTADGAKTVFPGWTGTSLGLTKKRI